MSDANKGSCPKKNGKLMWKVIRFQSRAVPELSVEIHRVPKKHADCPWIVDSPDILLKKTKNFDYYWTSSLSPTVCDFEFGVEGPPLYYGPFRDNVLREPLKNYLPTAICKLWLQSAQRSSTYLYLIRLRRAFALFAQSLQISLRNIVFQRFLRLKQEASQKENFDK